MLTPQDIEEMLDEIIKEATVDYNKPTILIACAFQNMKKIMTKAKKGGIDITQEIQESAGLILGALPEELQDKVLTCLDFITKRLVEKTNQLTQAEKESIEIIKRIQS